jgi:hypothetical protein
VHQIPEAAPVYGLEAPTTSQLREKAARPTARTAAFIPGATPPLVKTAIFIRIAPPARTTSRHMMPHGARSRFDPLV